MENNFFISNQWGSYLIKSILGEENSNNGLAEISQQKIDSYHNKIMKNVETKIFLLPLPIICQNDVTKIIHTNQNDKILRYYPPFCVNEKAQASASFQDIAIPTGKDFVAEKKPLPETAVMGFNSELKIKDSEWCRGFRIDAEFGIKFENKLDILLEQIAQYKQQWWLRAIHNPFLGPLRFAGQIDSDFNFVEEIK